MEKVRNGRVSHMSFDIERIAKSRRRVKKFFRKNLRSPSSTAIHDVRTSIRSLETTFTTMGSIRTER
jgi:hypothetical protein